MTVNRIKIVSDDYPDMYMNATVGADFKVAVIQAKSDAWVAKFEVYLNGEQLGYDTPEFIEEDQEIEIKVLTYKW